MGAPESGFTSETFEWFVELEENNNARWFADHRDTFRSRVDDPFTRPLEDVSDALRDRPTPLSGGAGTTFRMNRDVRFSADKSPYNVYRAGVLTPSGTKSETTGVVFVRLDSSGGVLFGGLYKPGSAQLEAARRALLERPQPFTDVLAHLAEEGYELDRSEIVKTMPRGYSEFVGHPHADSLRLKRYVVTRSLPRSAWLDDSIRNEVVGFATSVGPLMEWIAREAVTADPR